MKKEVKLSKRCRKDLMKKPNVVGVGIGFRQKKWATTAEKSIVVLVSKKMAPNELKAKDMVPRFWKGQQVDVVEIGEVRFMDGAADAQANKSKIPSPERVKRWRPAPGGVSIGHYVITAGTMGVVVRDRSSGARLILSNNHVLANTTSGDDHRAAPGDIILQPGAYDGGNINTDVLGRLIRFVPVRRTVYHSQCATAAAVEKIANKLLSWLRPHYQVLLQRLNQGGNLVDAALAIPEREEDLDDKILELGKINGVASAYLGQPIRFSGRTSGLVKGKILATEVSLYITMNPGEEVLFEDQLVTSAISRPGDSGSLLVDEHNRAVGLLFAGSDKVSICNRIDHVCRLLDIEIG
jgi:hypothetical protein